MNGACRKARSSCSNLRSKVLANDLCCGCGACVGVCPTGALAIDIFASHEPVIEDSKCSNCDLCYDVCPGRGYPIVHWTERQANEEMPMLSERGPVRQYLKGHSTNPEIRMASASGGIATSLLLHLLETGQVDEVAVIGMEHERPVPRLTSDPQVVLDAMMSKYGPVPMLATVIPELRNRPRRIAMTVTPCQLAGWMRAIERMPRLKESPLLTIGLFCGQIQNYDALTSIAATIDVRYPGEAKFVAWRHGTYPGSVRFKRSDGTVAEKPLYQWLDIAVPYFTLNRCFLCPDGGNWMADMTLGDIHQGGTDETVVVCRTRRGQEALDSARHADKIAIEELTPAQVESCVIQGITRSKLLPAISRNTWLKRRGKAAPEFDYQASRLFRGNLKWMIPIWILKYRMTFWARSGWLWRFLLKRPMLMEKIGHFIYYFPITIPGWVLATRIGKLLVPALRKNEGK